MKTFKKCMSSSHYEFNTTFRIPFKVDREYRTVGVGFRLKAMDKKCKITSTNIEIIEEYQEEFWRKVSKWNPNVRHLLAGIRLKTKRK